MERVLSIMMREIPASKRVAVSLTLKNDTGMGAGFRA